MSITLPFNPTMQLPTSDPHGQPLQTDIDPPAGLSSALSATRTAFTGLEDLPVDEPQLEGQEAELPPTEEPPPPATAVRLPIDPTAVSPAPGAGPDNAALQNEIALLRSEIAALRSPTPSYSPPPAPAPAPGIDEGIYTRVADRFKQNFQAIQEQRADESDADFEGRRARSFAETIVAAVYEDLLPSEAVQARFRPTAEQVAQTVAQRTIQQHGEAQTIQQQQDTLVAQAVAAARNAGYDVHLPGTSGHQTSRESRLFWGAATQIDPQLPGQEQIRQALELMPPKQPAAPSTTPQPALARPQPMGRQGAGPAPATAAGQAEEYQPMTMGGMISHGQRVRTFGGGAAA